MKKCKTIKDSLPLYLDDSLSGADKKAVEEHLKICSQCTKTLTQLSKTQTLVNSLAKVNPPPWFKQKIMARVREETEKKSLVQKMFYPLRIKIPVQIFATVFIAVIAVYIYRAGENQMKEVGTSTAPVMEFQKDQLPEQKNKIAADEAIQKKEQSLQIEERTTPKKDVTPQNVTATGQHKEQTTQGEERAIPRKDLMPERTAVADSDRIKDVNEEVASGAKADKYKGATSAKSIAMPLAAVEKKQESRALGAAMNASQTPQAQSPITKPRILLRVADIHTAIVEVERLLQKYEAKNIVRRTIQNKAILTAQLKNQKIKDFTVKLKTIGQIESKDISVDSFENEIAVVIEITGN
jgi:hypothetical protein